MRQVMTPLRVSQREAGTYKFSTIEQGTDAEDAKELCVQEVWNASLDYSHLFFSW